MTIASAACQGYIVTVVWPRSCASIASMPERPASTKDSGVLVRLVQKRASGSKPLSYKILALWETEDNG